MTRRTYTLVLLVALAVVVLAWMLRGDGRGLLAELGPMIHGR